MKLQTRPSIENFMEPPLNTDDERKLENQKMASVFSRDYLFSSGTAWFWLTVAIAITTILAVFLIPENAYPIVYFRYGLGFVFVLWLPGFTLMKTLYPIEVPVKTSSETVDVIERVTLTIAMSVILTMAVGLILNYTPWGINLASETLGLLTLTIIFAITALIRESQTRHLDIKPQNIPLSAVITRAFLYLKTN